MYENTSNNFCTFYLWKGLSKALQCEAIDKRKIFNYRLCHARRIIENVLGILVARFGIFKTHINIKLDNIKDVVMASCALHNFLCRTSPDTYTPPECFATEDLQNGTVTAGLKSNPSSMATLKRGK